MTCTELYKWIHLPDPELDYFWQYDTYVMTHYIEIVNLPGWIEAVIENCVKLGIEYNFKSVVDSALVLKYYIVLANATELFKVCVSVRF